MSLVWEWAGTDDPGDQLAASATTRGPSWWEIGPHGDGWSVSLVERDDAGVHLTSYGVLGSELAARSVAQAVEDAATGGRVLVRQVLGLWARANVVTCRAVACERYGWHGDAAFWRAAARDYRDYASVIVVASALVGSGRAARVGDSRVTA